MIYRLLAVMCAFSWSTLSYAVPVLNFNGNEVIGVSNVGVNGAMFDIQFLDGAFVDLYSEGIDPVFFQNIDNTVDAMGQVQDALLASAQFFSADQISGCASAPAAPLGLCGVLFPYAISDIADEIAVNVLYAVAGSGDVSISAFDALSLQTQSGVGPSDEDIDNVVFAVVTHQVSVPEPPTLLLLVLTLIGMARFRPKQFDE